jgi:transcriptional regulator with XRE-family HTH domain
MQELEDLLGCLREVRKKRGLTQVAAARVMGVAPLTFLRWENGYTRPKSRAQRAKLLEFLLSEGGATMPKREPFTLESVLYFLLDAIAAGATASEVIYEVIEKEGYAMDVPLPKKDVAITDLCKQIVAVAEKNPRAGKYYARLVAACRQAVEVDKKIEEA